jgi:MFS transporter, SP family, arabinose:H+ symporter
MTSPVSPQQDALDQLDERIPTWFYWQLTLLATIGGFLFGYDTANIGSVLSFVPYEMSDLVTGYLVAGASLGAAAGAFLAGPLTDRFGRKSLLIVDAGIYALGAIRSAVAWNVEVLLVARTLIGLAVGADSAIATAYIAEYAPRRRRGALSLLQQWMITVGIFASYLVALVVLWTMPDQATGLDWRLILGLGAVPALLALVLRTRMPESPRWLLRQGRHEDARKAFGMLGIEVTDEQVRASARRLEQPEQPDQPAQPDQPEAAAPPAGTSKSRWTAGVRRALAVVVVFFVFQQITGINVPFYYGPRILEPFFGGGTEVDAAIRAVAVTAVMSAVNVAATYFAFRFIDRIGRRKLALGGFAVMGLFMLVGAIGNGALAGVAQVAVVLIALDVFIVAFAIGVGGTGWLIQGEYFPTEVRGRAAAYGAVSDWLANFALILIFPLLLTAIGLSWVMVIFAALCMIAVAFVAAYMPETKELSVEEINRLFGKAAARGSIKPSGRGTT